MRLLAGILILAQVTGAGHLLHAQQGPDSVVAALVLDPPTLVLPSADRERYAPLLARVYELNGGRALWMDGDRLSGAGRSLLDAVHRAGDQGLNPDHYGAVTLDSLTGLLGAGAEASLAAMLDVGLTSALLRYADDLHDGRTHPPALSRSIPDRTWDPPAAIVQAAATADVAGLLARAQPPFRQYQLLARALSAYRDSAAQRPADTTLAGDVRRIALAMERLRWIPRLAAGRLIVVNVPAFELLAFDSVRTAGPALQMRVVVGDADKTRTPMVAELLTAIEFHPYWNVPRSIVVKEILPILQRRPDYLQAQQMEIVTPRGEILGDEVTPATRAGLADGSLQLRQRPGNLNALGNVKFIFPNAESIYLHDTPSRALFDETRRDFSHGCIRLEDAPSLAAWVLASEPGWSPGRVASALRDPATERIPLSAPIPVVVAYTTAVARADGHVQFYPDIYGHDRQLAAAMERNRSR